MQNRLKTLKRQTTITAEKTQGKSEKGPEQNGTLAHTHTTERSSVNCERNNE